MRLSTYRVILLFLATVTGVAAKDRQKAAHKDEISVAAHITLNAGPVMRFTATRHFDRYYVYAERGAGQPITLLDITNPNKPFVVAELEWANVPTSLIAASGTAALATSAALRCRVRANVPVNHRRREPGCQADV